MTRLVRGVLVLVGLAVAAADGAASDVVHRYALAAGANDGGSTRPTLRYASSDAESFARVMERLGGVDASDLVLLSQPTLAELEDALEELRRRVASQKSSGEGSGGRSEVLFYFSGHADDTGLLLGEQTLSYRSLRNWMDLIDADLRIAVLDACASGAITRLKGTRRRKAFQVDASSAMRGHAFLTSSSADEVAQESDRIAASFFTHYLVSGLRGAADVSGDGEVTLDEAYQFAFHETLGRTTQTRAGAQHPSYDIALSGTGEVVMTDIRETSAVLVLDEPLSGRFFVSGPGDRVVVELFKPRGRSVELALEPGRYRILNEGESGAAVSAATLPEDGRLVLGAGDFAAATRESVRVRGGEGKPSRFGGLDGRWRLGVTLGSWRSGGLGAPDSDYQFDSADTTGAVAVSRWLSEKWALDLHGWTTLSLVRRETLSPDDAYVAGVLVGGRRFFPGLAGLPDEARPYLAAALGPYFRHARAADGSAVSGVATGGRLAGGIEIQLARWCQVGGSLGYRFTVDFTEDTGGAFGSRTHYDGLELAVGVSLLWGRPTADR